MSKGGQDTDKSVVEGTNCGMGGEWVRKNRGCEQQSLEVRGWGDRVGGQVWDSWSMGILLEGVPVAPDLVMM